MSIIIAIVGAGIFICGLVLLVMMMQINNDLGSLDTASDYYQSEMEKTVSLTNVSHILIIIGIIIAIVGILLFVLNSKKKKKDSTSPEEQALRTKCSKCGMSISGLDKTCMKCGNDLSVQRKLLKQKLRLCPTCESVVSLEETQCPSCGNIIPPLL